MSRTSSKGRQARAALAGASGQSTIEFALTMILLISFVLFFFQLSMVFAFGNYVHYATFMAARAYLSAGPDKADQQQRAEDVLVSMLKLSAGAPNVDKFPSISRACGDMVNSNVSGVTFDPAPLNLTDPATSWLQGVRYSFWSKLFVVPFAGAAGTATVTAGPACQGGAGANRMILRSESFLGREPSDTECATGMKNQWNGLGTDGSLYDNGC